MGRDPCRQNGKGDHQPTADKVGDDERLHALEIRENLSFGTTLLMTKTLMPTGG